jgi:type I restriction enzyme S subunit
VLLERVIVEKETIAAERRLRKEKQIYVAVERFELPESWSWAAIGEIAHIMGGKRVPKGYSLQDEQTSHAYIRVTNMKNMSVDIGGLKYISDDVYEQISRYIISKDDVYISIAGTIGSAGTIPSILDGMNLTENAAKAVFRNIDKTYLVYTISSKYIQDQFSEAVNQMAQPKLSLNSIKETSIAIPPKAEQLRIVAKVNELMALCDQLEQKTESSLTAHQTLVETLLNTLLTAAQTTGTKESNSQSNSNQESSFDQAWNRIAQHFDVLFTTEHSIDQLKQTILQLAVMGKLTFPFSDDTSVLDLVEKIYEERLLYKNNSKEKGILELEYERARASVIKNRAEVKARFFCDFITKGTTPAKNELLEEEEVPFLKVYNIVNQKLDFDYKPTFISPDTHNKKLARSKAFPGDVIMNIVGPPLGKVAIITSQFPEWNMNQALAVYRPVGGVLSKYLYYTLSARVTLESVLKEVKGTAGQDNLSLEQCRDLIIILPSIEEQNRIVVKLEELMALCDTLKKHISETQATQFYLADAMAEQALV